LCFFAAISIFPFLLLYVIFIRKSLKIQTKKAACFSNRLRSSQIEQIVYSKSPLTCRILSRRPPPVASVFAVNLLHNNTILPDSLTFVKPHPKNKLQIAGLIIPPHSSTSTG